MADILFPDGTTLADVVANLNSFATLPTTSRGSGEIIHYSGDNTIRWNSQTTNPTTNPTWSDLSAGGVTDHGALTGLADDDHTQYMPVNASRNFTGDVSIDTATPSLDFAEGGSFRGGVYVNATDDFVMECELGKIILGTDPTNGDVIEINPKAGGVVATFNSTVITFAQMLAATKIVTGDHGTAATDEVVNVCYGTSATPPTASTTTEGALYIQYTA